MGIFLRLDSAAVFLPVHLTPPTLSQLKTQLQEKFSSLAEARLGSVMQKTTKGMTYVLDEEMVDYIQPRTVFVISIVGDTPRPTHYWCSLLGGGPWCCGDPCGSWSGSSVLASHRGVRGLEHLISAQPDAKFSTCKPLCSWAHMSKRRAWPSSSCKTSTCQRLLCLLNSLCLLVSVSLAVLVG